MKEYYVVYRIFRDSSLIANGKFYYKAKSLTRETIENIEQEACFLNGLPYFNVIIDSLIELDVVE